MKKERILLYQDNDAMRYAKRDSKELFKVMEDLLTIAESYVQVDVVKDYARFFKDPLKYMIRAYADIWNENLLISSNIDVSAVESLKERFNKLYDSLSEWNSEPKITKDMIAQNVKPSNFNLYCKEEKEYEYKVLLNFIEATRLFEDAFPTQSRRQISKFSDSLLDKDLVPRYELFAQFIDSK